MSIAGKGYNGDQSICGFAMAYNRNVHIIFSMLYSVIARHIVCIMNLAFLKNLYVRLCGQHLLSRHQS